MAEDRISQLPDEILQHILSFIDTTQAVRTSILSRRWKHQWRFLLNKEDRISQLPDETLKHILSFIDTSEAVQTSILSKRWKHLWRSLLNIRLHLFGNVSYYRLRHFVSQFLSHRDAANPLHGFHLSLHTRIRLGVAEALVEECVLYTINHGVRSLRLHAYNGLPLRLPTELSTSTTLRELEIRQRDTWIQLPPLFSLPNLKTLYLDANFSFHYDERMEPLAGLPELEKLSLRLSNGLVLKAPPKLRVLEIFGSDYVIRIQEISAPLLTSFRYKSFVPFECSKMNLPMLEEVDLDIHGAIYKEMRPICDKLLHQLGNATTVTLTVDTLKFLELDGGRPKQTPPFPNLKCLKVKKGRHIVRTVLQSVMNYLTVGTLYFESSLKVEIPPDVAVVERNELFDNRNFVF